MTEEENWDIVIEPKRSILDVRLGEIWKYKDLLLLFVWRDFVSVYKQTILGPLWFFIQPIITAVTFNLIFNNIANIKTDGIPPILFYMAGLTMWGYFAECLNKTSGTFTGNQGLFGKVYFPRLIVPLSVVITNLLKLGIQMLLFTSFWLYFYITTDKIAPNFVILIFPFLVLIMASLGLGIGMLVSALTTKYRDMTFLVGFGVSLLMYASPIIYPISEIKNPTILMVIKANPMTSIIETFKHAFLGTGSLDLFGLLYSAAFAIVVLFIGIIVFNKVEKSFIDTV
ncbi:MAG: ABC transporter permease [Flavobacteriales bacterium]|nr:ABC transporter permease [Flavobacteriales bacterium]